MNQSDPQAMISTWMSQFSDPNVWRTWFKPVPEINANPIAEILKEAGASIDPALVSKLQNDYTQQLSSLWQDFLVSKTTAITDRRFSSPEWHSNNLSSLNAASCLLNPRLLMKLADAVEAPPRVKRKISFSVRPMVDAMSPATFLVTNPEAQQKLVDT